MFVALLAEKATAHERVVAVSLLSVAIVVIIVVFFSAKGDS